MPVRVAVFIDWQNTYKAAREAFNLAGLPNERGNFSPYALARILAAGNGRGLTGHVVRVEIHRGLPSSSRDPIGYSANRRQSAAWMKENPEVVVPRLRPLRYPGSYEADQNPIEKGIDVQMALGAVEQVIRRACDVAIIFTHDTDLLPAVEVIRRLKGPEHVETASWSSHCFRRRLRQLPDVHHHQLSGAVFQRVETPVNYAYKGASG
jgi:hypothetical protein